MRRISPTSFRLARRGTFREINRPIALNLIRSKQPVSRAEMARLLVTTVWDLLSGTVRDALRADAIVREAGETENLTAPLGEHPRLRGAAALIGTPAFAAPVVS